MALSHISIPRLHVDLAFDFYTTQVPDLLISNTVTMQQRLRMCLGPRKLEAGAVSLLDILCPHWDGNMDQEFMSHKDVITCYKVDFSLVFGGRDCQRR